MLDCFSTDWFQEHGGRATRSLNSGESRSAGQGRLHLGCRERCLHWRCPSGLHHHKGRHPRADHPPEEGLRRPMTDSQLSFGSLPSKISLISQNRSVDPEFVLSGLVCGALTEHHIFLFFPHLFLQVLWPDKFWIRTPVALLFLASASLADFSLRFFHKSYCGVTFAFLINVKNSLESLLVCRVVNENLILQGDILVDSYS